MRLSDFVDLDFGVVSAVSDLLTETFPSLHFESDNFIAHYLTQDLCFNGSFQIANVYLAIGSGKKDFRKFYSITRITCNARNIQGLVLLNPELLTAILTIANINFQKLGVQK